jgi:hypothetical protein
MLITSSDQSSELGCNITQRPNHGQKRSPNAIGVSVTFHFTQSLINTRRRRP